MSWSVNAGLPNSRFLVAALRPITILDTPESVANSAICCAISSPYTVSTQAPSCPASRILLRSRFLSSAPIASAAVLSTKRAVKPERNAWAIRAAVRMIFALEGEEERQTRICSSVWYSFRLCRRAVSMRRFTRSAQRRRAISRRAVRFSFVKKWRAALSACSLR